MRRLLIVPLMLGLVACSAPDPVPGGSDTSREAVDGSGARAIVYVDVRSPQEFAGGHVRGAINIPHTEMAERWGELETHRDDSLVVYCRSGRRSALALDVLERQGFRHLRNGGALDELARQGVPVR